jgi:hypothetical protein
MSPDATELLKRLLTPSDDFPTEEEIVRERRRRFDDKVKHLERNRALSQPAEAASLALSAAADLSRLVRAGSWPAAMHESLVALFSPYAARLGVDPPLQLGSFDPITRQVAADILLDNIVPFCKAAFGVTFRGRPTNDVREEDAVTFYILAIDSGLSEEAASVFAFDAYFGMGAYARQLTRACGKEDGCHNQAEQSMKKVIHPLLRRAQVRKKREAGRKPKR